ncbi:lipase family alpha/beta hydrolase [Pseudoalteromonas sp. SSM20]|uniref:lipase family alpha/beta hydrolase n=1 Tax=Pseudoalteromonas sp. SSM20 TaxID=3139394 RepID=UPI003BAC7254
MKRISLILLLLLLVGCQQFKKAKEQAALLTSIAEISGTVNTKLTGSSDNVNLVAAVLIRNGDEFKVENQKTLGSSNQFQFYLKPGTYYFAVYQDDNHNLVYDEGERAIGHVDDFGTWQPIVLNEKEKKHLTSLRFSTPRNKKRLVKYNDNQFINRLGKVVNLAASDFDIENVDLGFWHPIDFVSQVDSGLFMLSPYQENKEPLILIHGIKGNPREFSAVIEAFKNSQYQIWVLYYPSGVGLGIVRDYLVEGVDILQKRHGFARVSVLAHSMGGLIARGYLLKHQEIKSNYHINQFATVNSPLLGMESAEKGVKNSPIVINSWYDVASNSDYVKTLNAHTLSDAINYSLVFSYKSGYSGDGVVSLASQIPTNIQNEASSIRGFEATHAGILQQNEFVQFIKRQFNVPEKR